MSTIIFYFIKLNNLNMGISCCGARNKQYTQDNNYKDKKTKGGCELDNIRKERKIT